METAPLSLYFGVEKGDHADLETIAKAAIEWVEVVKDLASIVAPDLEFEIEFVESEEGSVWLSNLITAVKSGDRKALVSLTAAVILFFAAGPALHLQSDIGDEFWERLGHEHDIQLSEEDKIEIVRRLAEAVEQTQAADRRRNLIREVEKDSQIKSIGVDTKPSLTGPVVKISRDDFLTFGAPPPAENKILQKKDTEIRHNMRVKIVRASLEEGDSKPRWRFRENDTKWSADIEDDEFIIALNLEKTGLPLAVGQTMVVDVAIDSKLIDGAWEEDNRRIINVIEPIVKRRQGRLGLGGN